MPTKQTIAPTRKVLILHDVEGDKCFDISSPEQYASVALSIVKSRFEAGFYVEPQGPTLPTLSYSQVKRLPEGEFRNFGLAVWQRYREAKARFERESAHWQLILQCVQNKDGETAVNVLASRQELQGESYDILNVITSF